MHNKKSFSIELTYYGGSSFVFYAEKMIEKTMRQNESKEI